MFLDVYYYGACTAGMAWIWFGTQGNLWVLLNSPKRAGWSLKKKALA